MTEFVWPDRERFAFAEAEGLYPVNLDWLRAQRGMRIYRRGYREAAEAVYRDLVEVGHPGLESAFFPLVFLWRHHHELSLKEIIGAGVELEVIERPNSMHTHDLGTLWRLALPILEDLGSEDAPELPIVQSGLDELQAIDPGADQFRYPTTRNGGASLAAAPKKLSLDRFQEAMCALEAFFDGSLEMLNDRMVWADEAQAYDH